MRLENFNVNLWTFTVLLNGLLPRSHPAKHYFMDNAFDSMATVVQLTEVDAVNVTSCVCSLQHNYEMYMYITHLLRLRDSI